MKQIKKYLKLDTVLNRNIFYLLFFCMLVLTLFRIIVSFKNNQLIDFVFHLDAATAICHNLDPYDLKNLRLSNWDCPLR